jgi:hypothetical protein
MIIQWQIDVIRDFRIKFEAIRDTYRYPESGEIRVKKVMTSGGTQLMRGILPHLMKVTHNGEDIPCELHFSAYLTNVRPEILETCVEIKDIAELCQTIVPLVSETLDTEKVAWWEELPLQLTAYIQLLYQIPDFMTPQTHPHEKWEMRNPVVNNEQIVWEEDGFRTNIASEPDQEYFDYISFRLQAYIYRVLSKRQQNVEKAFEIIKQYQRVYWRGNGERTYEYHILRMPSYIGVSLKHFHDIQKATSYGMEPLHSLNLANVFGGKWRQYAARKAQNPIVKRIISNPELSENIYDFTIDGCDEIKKAIYQDLANKGGFKKLIELVLAVGMAIHDAAVCIPKMSPRRVNGLEEYMLTYDFVKYAPYTRLVAMSWNALTEEERKFPPEEAATSIMQRSQALMTNFSNYSEEFKKEMQWLIPCVANEAHMDESALGLFATEAERVYKLYTDSQLIPMPQWATGEAECDGYTARFLPRNDPRGLFIGHYTSCCQHIGGGIAEKCAIHAQQSPYAANLVIENPRGEIFACSWVWEGSDGRICFDNVEAKVKKLAVVKQLIEQIATQIDMPFITTGTSYTDIDVSEYETLEDEDIHLPVDYPEDGYSDAKKQVVLKRQLACVA